ncbi:unnamed protein product [Ambrosiozyma monospora]|uniref:Unnamed protein product n=1 Tax=Ambrosiozyma monospora TaxID=43982 RepID=A0A9W6T1D6_AMBMO|nr:unnamed protein product [Ambrosiozyma monospora]
MRPNPRPSTLGKPLVKKHPNKPMTNITPQNTNTNSTNSTNSRNSIKNKAMKHKLQQLIQLTLQLYIYSLKLTFQLLIQPIFFLLWKETTKFMRSLNPEFVQNITHQLLNLLIVCLGFLGSSLRNFVEEAANDHNAINDHNEHNEHNDRNSINAINEINEVNEDVDDVCESSSHHDQQRWRQQYGDPRSRQINGYPQPDERYRRDRNEQSDTRTDTTSNNSMLVELGMFMLRRVADTTSTSTSSTSTSSTSTSSSCTTTRRPRTGKSGGMNTRTGKKPGYLCD